MTRLCVFLFGTTMLTSSAVAQQALPLNSIPYSRGPGVTTWAGIPVVANQVIITGPGGVPASSTRLPATNFPALTGDVTTTAGSLAATLAAGSASVLNSGTLPSARISGAYSGLTGTGALVSGSIGSGFTIGLGTATLSGVIPSANVSGAYTGITGTGTLTSGTTGAGFTVALATSTLTGVLPSANVSGVYAGITGVGTLTSGALNGLAITGLPSCTLATDACPKSFIDSIAAGFHNVGPSGLATAAILPDTPVYANGAAGVGATIQAGGGTTLTVDGIVAVIGSVVLVKNEGSAMGLGALANGIYRVSQATTPWILTRCVAGAGSCTNTFNSPSTMTAGSFTTISGGATNIGNSYSLQTTVAAVGTNTVDFVLAFVGGSGVSSIQSMNGAIGCGATLTCSAGSIGVATNGITNTQILNGTIAFAKLVGTDITTVGTIASGIWSAGAVTSSGAVTGLRFIPTSNTAPTNGMFLPAANTLGLAINSSERVRINNNFFGIGTTSPAVALDVVSSQGVLGLTSSSPTNYGAVLITNGSGVTIFGADTSGGGGLVSGGLPYAAVAGTAGPYPFELIAGGSIGAILTTSGHFGIGTSTPTTRFEVKNAGGATTVAHFTANDYVAGSVGSSLLFFYGAASGNTTSNLQALTAGASTEGNLVLQGLSGNVGIGNVNPSSQLHTTGSVRFAGLPSGCLVTGTTGILYAKGCEAASVAAYGADCQAGTASQEGALTSARTASATVLVPIGCTLRISADTTFTAGGKLIVPCGALISVDAGKTLTIRSEVPDPGQCQIFTGSGTVTGIRANRPDWWGADPTGVADSTAAIAASSASAYAGATAGNDGTTDHVAFSCGYYQVTSGITYQTSALTNWIIEGCGPYGTTVVGVGTGYSVITIAPTSGSATRFQISKLGITPNTVNTLTCLTLGSGTFSLQAQSTTNVVEDMFLSGCNVGLGWHNTRLVTLNRVGIWLPNDGAGSYSGAIGISVTSNNTGDFAGDSEFNGGQLVCGLGTTGGVNTGIKFASTSTGNISGWRFHGFASYYCKKHIEATTDATSTMGDFWWDGGSQFEGSGTWGNGSVLDLVTTGGSGFRAVLFNFDGVYYTAGSGTAPVFHLGGATTDAIQDVNIRNMRVRGMGAGTQGRFVEAENVRALNINNNQIIDFQPQTGGTNDLIFLHNTTHATITSNTAVTDGSPVSYFSISTGTTNDVVISGNNARGAATSIYNNANGAANVLYTGLNLP